MRPVRGVWTQLHDGIRDSTASPRSRRRWPWAAGREVDPVFELSPAFLAVAGFDGYLRRFNPAFEVFGYSRDELLSRPWNEFAHPDDRALMEQAAASLERGTDVVRLENRVVCRDGSLRWVEWSTRIVHAEGVFYAAGRDVTESRRAGQEQGALRRVATLLAQEAPPDAVFAAVVREAGELLGLGGAYLGRLDPDGTVVRLAQWGNHTGAPADVTSPLDSDATSSRTLRAGGAVRMDGNGHLARVTAALSPDPGTRFSVCVPIGVEGRTWGVIVAVSMEGGPLPAETEARLQGFTELAATAIANGAARLSLRVLAEEQAALRRVATLVAEGAAPGVVFDTVTAEVAQLLDVSTVSLARYEDDELKVVAQRGEEHLSVGEPRAIGGLNVTSTVPRAGDEETVLAPEVQQATDLVGNAARTSGRRSMVTAPVIVEGRTWGVLAAVWTADGPPPQDTKDRMGVFAQLLATAIANADSRTQLVQSRARLVTTADDARRRLARDLHDGAQQRLVHTIVTLKLALRASDDDAGDGRSRLVLLGEALAHAEGANAALRDLVHGILPAVLTDHGLRAAVDDLVARVDLPVTASVTAARLPPIVEASAYFVIAESLTNVVKHANATCVNVQAWIDETRFYLEIRDDGVGGADAHGAGLVGLRDRIAALGGHLQVDSPRGRGTSLRAEMAL